MARLIHFCSSVERVELFISPDVKRTQCDRSFNLDMLLDTIMYNFFDALDPKMKELIELNAKQKGLGGIAVLAAHGIDDHGMWCYFIENELHLTQDWIRSKDGRYKLLILNSCNPTALEIRSRHSAVLTPNSTYSQCRRDNGEVQLELYLPGIGYVDSYLVDSVLEDMKAKVA